MTACQHPHLDCGTTDRKTGTLAWCRECDASIAIPPVTVPKGQTKTLAGLGLSAKDRMAWDVDLFHAEALAGEAMRGAREWGPRAFLWHLHGVRVLLRLPSD